MSTQPDSFVWQTGRSRRAVMLVCDQAFLPYASFVAWQVAIHSGARDFDIVIVSYDKLELPPILQSLGVTSRQVERDPRLDVFPPHKLPSVAYLVLQLPEIFRSEYDRILYLDSDLFFEGGDLSALLGLDLKGAPVAAVRDVGVFYDPQEHAQEFKLLGLPPTPYINTGVVLVDTAKWSELNILHQAVELASQRPDLFVFHDQSILNAVLKGNIAELHPGWNWQPNIRLAAVSQHQPVMFRHFITPQKPFRPTGDRHDHRFWAAYRNFFQAYAPDWLSLLPARQKAAPAFDAIEAFRRYWDQKRTRKTVNAYLARFADEWTVIRWRPVGEV